MVISDIDRNIARTKALYFNSNPFIPAILEESLTIKKAFKRKSLSLPSTKIDINETGIFKSLPTAKADKSKDQLLLTNESNESINTSTNMDIALYDNQQARQENTNSNPFKSTALTTRRQFDKVVTPQWHAPWELSAVISGHIGWVRSISFDPSNEWFATGSADRTIKIWDLAKCCAGSEGGLKLTLTGHVSAIRGLVVSPRHPYLFSAGEDKMVKCWDLEYNKVIRHYHGHLSGVFCIALHPTLDLLVTGGRDSVARVWDIRTKHQIHVLGGHSNTVGGIITNSVDPQIITSSYDSTIKLWDLAAGKSMTTLTQHKKAVRHICPNIKEFSFVSCGADNVKKWQSRDGRFLMNFSGHNSIINCTAVNEDGVMVTCGDNGSMMFWDYNSGYSFQQTNTIAQPGSLDAEAGIFAASFDLSGSRLITCEADKSIKIWKENSEATEETHPIDMDGWTKKSLKLKRY